MTWLDMCIRLHSAGQIFRTSFEVQLADLRIDCSKNMLTL